MSKPLGNEDARAQVGTNGGLSQRWREKARFDRSRSENSLEWIAVAFEDDRCADELDAAKLRIEEALKALASRTENVYADVSYSTVATIAVFVEREAVLKIIREIL